jgi:hypothetical protein
VAQGVPGRLRPRIFLMFRHYEGDRSSAKRTGRLYPRRNPWYSLSEAESTSGHMVLSGVPQKKSPVTPPGIDPGTVRLVAQLTFCSTHTKIRTNSGTIRGTNKKPNQSMRHLSSDTEYNHHIISKKSRGNILQQSHLTPRIDNIIVKRPNSH